AMAAGIAADRADLFDAGARSFEVGVAQIQPDGTLPLELARRSRALHYHLFACAPLVILAELAAANGRNFYGARDGAVARLAERALSGLADPSFFAQRTGVSQEPVGMSGHTVAWITPFVARFPERSMLAPVRRGAMPKGLYIGGLPPM
ncbi:MAG TPA: alginate lyase family protein, partial [Beijerinckiaceae bacterium]|nr:alginate lyase family protein [Beijerinckiaceae bacterium]